MNKLELKRKELELGRISQAKQELEFKIEESLDQIERIKQQIVMQEQREEQLKEELKQMKEVK